jgi:hypothetical protein
MLIFGKRHAAIKADGPAGAIEVERIEIAA